eukprot:Amastigsp_a340141_25.p5 type:complete len:110 gc:universal Amastigsp_a340141_25:756-427(-)
MYSWPAHLSCPLSSVHSSSTSSGSLTSSANAERNPNESYLTPIATPSWAVATRAVCPAALMVSLSLSMNPLFFGASGADDSAGPADPSPAAGPPPAAAAAAPGDTGFSS